MKQIKTNTYPVQELQLIYKQKFCPADRPKITSSEDAYKCLLGIWNLEVISFIEEFKILLLNRANRVMGVYSVSSGGICGTVADPRVIFAVALKACAVGLILAHNHPSGNLTPSQQDVELTQKLEKAGTFLDITILDHIILTPEGYYSFKDSDII